MRYVRTSTFKAEQFDNLSLSDKQDLKDRFPEFVLTCMAQDA